MLKNARHYRKAWQQKRQDELAGARTEATILLMGAKETVVKLLKNQKIIAEA